MLLMAVTLIAALILAIGLVPSGKTVQDAENDVHNQRGLFAVLCILAVIGLVFAL